MQRSRKKLLIRGLLFFCSIWILLPLPAAVHSAPTAAQQLGQLATEWMNQFGQSAIVLNPSCSTYRLCGGHGELLLPLHQQGQQRLFTQLGLQHDSLQTTYYIGVAQRHLTRSPGYWGYNLFYDYRRQGNHSRLGLGLERHGAQGMVRLNGYLPLSNWRFDAENTLQSRPAEGIDLQLQRAICQQPDLRVQLLLTHYFSHSLAREAEKQSSPGSSTATVGFDYAPVPLFNAGYSYQISSSGLRTHQLQFSVIYRLGVPLAQQFDPQQVVNAHSLNNSHFELIKRQSRMVLQQRSAPVVPAAVPEESKESKASEASKVPEISEEPKDTSQTLAVQPASMASDDIERYQDSAQSGASEKMFTTENALDSSFSRAGNFDLGRTSIASVSTTTSSTEVPVNIRGKRYLIETNDIKKFLKCTSDEYKVEMKKLQINIKKGQQISPTMPNTKHIDLNNISPQDLLSIKGVGPNITTKILLIRKITRGEGTIQEYENGIILTDLLDCEVELKGINSFSLNKKTKTTLLGK